MKGLLLKPQQLRLLIVFGAGTLTDGYFANKFIFRYFDFS